MNHPFNQSDEDLAQSLASGYQPALAELSSRYAPGVYDFALRAMLDESLAAAVTEGTFRRVTAEAGRLPHDIGFRTWLYSLTLAEIAASGTERLDTQLQLNDERFLSTDIADREAVFWAWQAARGLRMRDYCVLDLTVRRGLIAEELADAASLTRNNLYASIGRAQGAFEETFNATVLYLRGRERCPELAALADQAGDATARAGLRNDIALHADSCNICRATLAATPEPGAILASLRDVELPFDMRSRILTAAGLQEPAPRLPLEEPVVAALPPTAEAAYEPEEAQEDEPFAEEAGEDESYEPLDAPRRPARQAVFGALTEQETELGQPAAPARSYDRDEDWRALRRVEDESFRERIASRIGELRTEPITSFNWRYLLLGVATVAAIYIGIAVGTSIQSGGSASGAVPLDGSGDGRAAVIECGDQPIALAYGTVTVVSFDPEALSGFTIDSLEVDYVHPETGPDLLKVEAQDATSVRFEAAPIASTTARSDPYRLRIHWERGSQRVVSDCEIVVDHQP